MLGAARRSNSGPNYPRVSLNRPMNLCPWGAPFTWELPLLCWAERNGYQIDVCTNLDLEFHPEILPGYRLVLSVGHDEYWSAGMRDHLEAFVAAGGNCAFFSGNTCCWQVRVEDQGRALVCHKKYHDRDPRLQDRRSPEPDHALERPDRCPTGEPAHRPWASPTAATTASSAPTCADPARVSTRSIARTTGSLPAPG